MMVPSVKKEVVQCGWNPLNMNYLFHPEIVKTKLSPADASEQLGDLDDQLARNNLTKDLPDGLPYRLNLTEADIQVLRQGPWSIKEFNWAGNITRQVFQNCCTRMERYKVQDKEFTEIPSQEPGARCGPTRNLWERWSMNSYTVRLV